MFLKCGKVFLKRANSLISLFKPFIFGPEVVKGNLTELPYVPEIIFLLGRIFFTSNKMVRISPSKTILKVALTLLDKFFFTSDKSLLMNIIFYS